MGHACQPDGYDTALFEIQEPGKPKTGGDFIKLTDTLGSSGNQLLRKVGIGGIAHAMLNTPMGAFVPNNYPPEFAHMATAEGTTRIGETDVQRGMDRGTGDYNKFLERLNIPVSKSYRELFQEPDSPEAQKVIAEWERLFGEYNEASGELYLTTGMGQLAAQFRPDGYAVPNPTFMNFVMEASTRFMHNEWLTKHAGPKYVTPTGANIVNSVTFEHLLAKFAPELRDYLEARERPSVFSNKQSNIPHPIEEHVEYGEEKLSNMGAGAPFLEAHWTGKGLEDYELRRLQKDGKSYIVDMTDKMVYIDHDNDGRIRMDDAVFSMPKDGPTAAELFAAVDYGEGLPLSTREIRMVKQDGKDKKNRGVSA